MAAGISVSRATFDTQIGQHARNLQAELQFWKDVNTWIGGVAGGFSGLKDTNGVFGAQAYTDVPTNSGDASRVFNGAADIAQLYNIAHNTATLGSVKDFFANLQFLTGTP